MEKQLKHYWGIARKIIREANKYGGTNRERQGYDALYQIREVVKGKEISWDLRRSVVDEMMEEFYQGNSGFDDTLVNTCGVLCSSKEEELYLAGKLKKSSSHYYKKIAADIFEKYGQANEFIEILSTNLKYGSDYIALAEHYKKEGQPELAVELVEGDINNVYFGSGDVYAWLFKEYAKRKQEDKIQNLYNRALRKQKSVDVLAELMYQYYRNDYGKMRQYLFKMLEVCRTDAIRKWYDECATVLHADDWATQKEQIQKTIKQQDLNIASQNTNLEEIVFNTDLSIIQAYTQVA